MARLTAQDILQWELEDDANAGLDEMWDQQRQELLAIEQEFYEWWEDHWWEIFCHN